MSAFPARYRGECAECGAWFPEGTLIRYDDRKSIAHAEPGECVTIAEYERAPHEVACPDCFCVHAGGCA